MYVKRLISTSEPYVIDVGCIDDETACMVARSMVGSHLDYCNFVSMEHPGQKSREAEASPQRTRSHGWFPVQGEAITYPGSD